MALVDERRERTVHPILRDRELGERPLNERDRHRSPRRQLACLAPRRSRAPASASSRPRRAEGIEIEPLTVTAAADNAIPGRDGQVGFERNAGTGRAEHPRSSTSRRRLERRCTGRRIGASRTRSSSHEPSGAPPSSGGVGGGLASPGPRSALSLERYSAQRPRSRRAQRGSRRPSTTTTSEATAARAAPCRRPASVDEERARAHRVSHLVRAEGSAGS